MSKVNDFQALYTGRELSDGYPDMERLGVEYQAQKQTQEADTLYTPSFMQCASRLIDLIAG
jgi:hypothetical protein